jgi:hypothetical protein
MAVTLWDVNDLAAASDLGRELHVVKSAVTNWVARHPDFPAPITVIASAKVYSLIQVREWQRSKGWH